MGMLAGGGSAVCTARKLHALFARITEPHPSMLPILRKG